MGEMNGVKIEWANIEFIECDRAVWDVEHDNKRYITYEVMGMSEDDIDVKEEFLNKSRTMFVTARGKVKSEITGVDNDINVKQMVNTNVYDKWSYEIKNGLLTIVLYEKINVLPQFSLVEYNG